MLKRTAFAALLAAAVTGQANAADLPIEVPAAIVAVPVFNWTGFYVGVHGGYGRAENDVNTVGNNGPGSGFTNTVLNVQSGLRPGSLGVENDGFVGGVQLGYNVQFGNIVIGVEADFSYTDLDGSTAYIAGPTALVALPAGGGGQLSVLSSELEWLSTVRGRVGFAFDRALVYATGGLAIGRVNDSAAFFGIGGTPLQYSGAAGGTETGYVIGAGFEYALAGFSFFNSSAVTIRAEYLYYDLGDRSITVASTGLTPAATGSYTSNFEHTGHIVRAGINVKF